MSIETQFRSSCIKIHAPKPIRSKAYTNNMQSIKSYSKTPVSNQNGFTYDEISLKKSFRKQTSEEIDMATLDEIEQDFSLFKTKSELCFSSDEIIDILNTPKTLSQSIRSFDHYNEDSHDLGIERVKNPIYKALEGNEDNL